MLQKSLLIMKNLNKIETPIYVIRSVFFASKGNLFDVYLQIFPKRWELCYLNLIEYINNLHNY